MVDSYKDLYWPNCPLVMGPNFNMMKALVHTFSKYCKYWCDVHQCQNFRTLVASLALATVISDMGHFSFIDWSCYVVITSIRSGIRPDQFENLCRATKWNDECWRGLELHNLTQEKWNLGQSDEIRGITLKLTSFMKKREIYFTCKTWVQVITRKSTCFTRHFCNCLSWHLLCLRQKSPGCSRPRFICRGPELTMGQIQALTVGSRQVAVMGRQERGRDGWILGAGIRTPASNIAAVISCRSSHPAVASN